MAKEFLIDSTYSFLEVSAYVVKHFDGSNQPLKFKITQSGKRSLSQNAFSHLIYSKISDYLIHKGRKDWTPHFVKENLKNKFIGWCEQEFIDVKTGEKKSHMVLRKTSKLDKGEFQVYLTQILDWAESIGCRIEIPEDSEYMKNEREQNGI